MSTKIILVCGPRNWENEEIIDRMLVRLAAEYGTGRIIILQGGAPGVDLITKRLAQGRGIHTATVEALWDTYNRAAGPIRNAKMLVFQPDFVIALHWDLDESKGTANMVKQARKAKVPVRVILRPLEVAKPSIAYAREEAAKRKAKRRPKKPKQGAAGS